MFAVCQLSMHLIKERPTLDTTWQARAMAMNMIGYELAIIGQFLHEKMYGTKDPIYGDYQSRINFMRSAASAWFSHPDLSSIQDYLRSSMIEIVDMAFSEGFEKQMQSEARAHARVIQGALDLYARFDPPNYASLYTALDAVLHKVGREAVIAAVVGIIDEVRQSDKANGVKFKQLKLVYGYSNRQLVQASEIFAKLENGFAELRAGETGS
jgi:hypothetical protein